MSQQLQGGAHAQNHYPQNNQRTFHNTQVYRQIQDAGQKYKNRLNFTFRAHEVLQLLDRQPYNQKLERTLRKQLQSAVDRVDKRPIDDQIKLKNRYQKSHGLVFKGIPLDVQRQVVFHAIEKLGATTKDESGESLFPGELKMRTFMYPKVKDGQKTRNAFPIFVNKKDQLFLYQWSKNQESYIELDPEPTEECPDFSKEQWNGMVVVEKVRGADGEMDLHNEIPVSLPHAGGYGAHTPGNCETPPVVATPPPGSVDIASQLAQVLNMGGAAPMTPPRVATAPAYGYSPRVGHPMQLPIGQNFVPFDPRLVTLDRMSGCSTPMSQSSDIGYYDVENGRWVTYPLPTTSPVVSHQSIGSFSSEHSIPPMQFQQFAQQLEQTGVVHQIPVMTQPHPAMSPVLVTMPIPSSSAPPQASPAVQSTPPAVQPHATVQSDPHQSVERAKVVGSDVNVDSPGADDLD